MIPAIQVIQRYEYLCINMIVYITYFSYFGMTYKGVEYVKFFLLLYIQCLSHIHGIDTYDEYHNLNYLIKRKTFLAGM